jgi:hypothetical protein
MNSASALHSSVLPTPVGPRNRNEPLGRFGSESPPRAADRIGYRTHRLVLTDHALVQRLFHAQQLVALAFEHLGDRNAGPARHDFGDFLLGDLVLQQLEVLRLGRLRGGELLFQLRQFAVLDLAHARNPAALRRYRVPAVPARSAP